MIPIGAKIEKTYKFGDAGSPVAVATLASDYEKFDLKGYAILGSVFTENLGVQLAIANMLKYPNVRYLILCGQESQHLAGDAFKSLHENGAARMGTYRRIIGCKSPLPFVDDIPEWAIDEYQEIITLIDMIGIEDESSIQIKIDECIDEFNKSPATREVMDINMSEVDEFTWKKYAPIVESAMKSKLNRK
jgi:tetrahydromethanopterin S-methyltransferase subunit A